MGNWARMNQVGGGLLIPLGKDFNGNIEIRLMYQNTSRLDYLKSGDTIFRPDPDGQANGIFEYNTRRSSLNMIQPSIGISFYFD
jgi:hypothetical protein